MQFAETAALAAPEVMPAGQPAAAPPQSALPFIDWGGQVLQTGKVDEAGRMIIDVYFGGPSDHPDLPEWNPDDIAAVWQALAQFEKIVGVVFRQIATPEGSDFRLIGYDAARQGVLLGEFEPPGEPNAGLGTFDFTGRGWTPAGLLIGGYGFNTLVHEIGHGLGLAHPHDNGGGSPILPTVDDKADPGDPYTPGGQRPNLGVWTMMSYIDGWLQHPAGNVDEDEYGNIAGPMAWDIALLQQKYGANMDWATGNDVYVLPAADGAGTYYSAIWDAGGWGDWIVAGSAVNVTIDLRPASLLLEDGGGGWMSFAQGVHGGYTIANGVVIENAQGGTGNDLLVGNDISNIMQGQGGNDSLYGLDGNDVLNGGAGDDILSGGNGDDQADYSDAAGGVTVRLTLATRQNTVGAGRDLLVSIEGVVGSAFSDVLAGNAESNSLIGNAGDDRLDGLGGNDLLDGGAGNDRLVGGDGDDNLVDMGDGADSLYGGAGNDRLTVLHSHSNSKVVVDGGDGNDFFVLGAAGGMTFAYGGAGDDQFILRAEATVSGGAGRDSYGFDLSYEGPGPVIFTDFEAGAGGDILHLEGLFELVLDGWDTVSNPFMSGYVRLMASGANTLLQIDSDAAGGTWAFTTLAVFKNLALNALTLDNLGFAPPSIILGTAGADTLAGGKADDIIHGLGGADSLKGQGGNDLIDGGDGDDLLYGLAGDDHLLGGAGNDKLTAADGADWLEGGAGNDYLIGGLGADVMTGGVGADIFLYTSAAESGGRAMDLITDFAVGQGDRINLSAIDANTGLEGNQAFAFAADFTGVAGQLIRGYNVDLGRTVVSGDVNGDGLADFAFQIVGDHTSGAFGWML